MKARRAAEKTMPKPKKTKTLADLARALHKRKRKLTSTEIAEQIGSTRQAVDYALAVTNDRQGRPGVESRTQRLAVELLDQATAQAGREGVSARDWIETAIRTRLQTAKGAR
jgi:hypothetical protein